MSSRCGATLETSWGLNISPPGWEGAFGLLRNAFNTAHGWSRLDNLGCRCQWGETIPPVQAVVVNKADGIPGIGVTRAAPDSKACFHRTIAANAPHVIGTASIEKATLQFRHLSTYPVLDRNAVGPL